MAGRYITSAIDGKEYCKSNGRLLRHINSHGFATYREYYDEYIGKAQMCECGQVCAFCDKDIQYKRTCKDRKCIGRLIKEGKSKRTPEQEQNRVLKFQKTMKNITPEERTQIQQRKDANYLKKHGVKHRLQQQVDGATLELLQDKEWMTDQHIVQQKTAVEISNMLGVGITTATNWIHRHEIPIQHHNTSQGHRDLLEFINGITNDEVLTNDRQLISPLELDIVIPARHLAIEYNGVFWHSELNGKDRRYHLDKTEKTNAAGLRLIHISEVEWLLNTDLVKSRLISIFKTTNRIYGRATTIRLVDAPTQQEFLSTYHLQGYCPASVGIALEYDGAIVSMMTFGKSRFDTNHEWELLRYASIFNTTIVGGATKMFKWFITNINPASVVSYCSVNWNTGSVYKIMGFEHSYRSPPGYYYFETKNPLRLWSRNKFQKHKQAKILETFDPQLTEWQNMVNNNYDRIWNCGNDVYSWTAP